MRAIVVKDKLNNKIISIQKLSETDNIRYEIVDDIPEIEAKDGYVGEYILNQDGSIGVVYKEAPKTALEKVQEENDENMIDMIQVIASLK